MAAETEKRVGLPWTRIIQASGLAVAVAVGCSGLFGPLAPDAERGEGERMLDELLATRTLVKSGSSWAGLGFHAQEIDWANGKAVSLTPNGSQDMDEGIYYVRQGMTAPILLQAPHAKNDRLTGEIALELMRESEFAAAALSSQSRFLRDDEGEQADLAHRSDGYFAAFSRAFINTYADGVIAQLHGFEPGNQESMAAATANLIVSNGTHVPSPDVLQLRDCLAGQIDGAVLVFPDEVGELGGTTNAIAAIVHDAGRGRFIHLEMSPGLREKMVGAGDLRRRFAGCLLEIVPR
jgi:hypothetical protein